METTVLAIAAVALLCVQTHRNYLMVRAQRSVQPIQVSVSVPKIEIPTALAPIISVKPSNLELDYNKLGAAIEQALIKANVKLHNANVQPAYIPSLPQPTWQQPIISEAVSEPLTIETASGVEVPVRKFSSK